MPLRAGGQVIGVLTAGWSETQPFDAEQLAVLETFAAQCAQALQRLAARQAERAAAQAARRAARQQASLVGTAQALGGAESQDDVLAVIDAQGKELLNAGGAALCLLEPEGAHVRTLVTDDYTSVRTVVQRTPADFPLPSARSAATGATYFHASRAQTAALFPGAGDLYAAAGVQASAAVPLRARGHLLGCLSVGFAETRAWSQDEQDLVAAFAALTAQALERIASREAERAASHAVARFSETLQRSLLTKPAQPDHLQIAVRYSPAALDAQVGGDWYDAFLTADGTTSLVVGDVTGHDQHAAAAVGQLRNLLRGIGYSISKPPAEVLTVLDRAVHDLDVEATATMVLAQVQQSPDQQAAGLRTLRWSNAGHPPPLLITPAGTTSYLTTEPDLLLGLDPDTSRTNHDAVLQTGSTVLLFTDGLIERRGAHLQAGLDWLAHTVADLAHLTLDELCDALLARIGDRTEDDVALLALRAHHEDAPRPPDAGPVSDPRQQPTLTSGRPACTPAHPLPGTAGATVDAIVDATGALVLEPQLTSVRQARAFVQARCQSAGVGRDASDTAVLLTSEVVTNAVLHGRSPARLSVSIDPDTIRVDVTDDNSRHPTLAPRDDEALDGRGMNMVDALANAWGVSDEHLGKTVWFTIANNSPRQPVSGPAHGTTADSSC